MKCKALLVDDHWLHHPMKMKQSNFNSHIYTLFLDHFCVLIVKMRRRKVIKQCVWP